MIMTGESRRLSQPLRWGRREKSAVAAVLIVAVLACAALVSFALTSGAPPRRDCIKVSFASTLGGAQLHACGTRARRVCASPGYAGIAHELATACRSAGLPYRPQR
jgi:hypothetical protein